MSEFVQFDLNGRSNFLKKKQNSKNKVTDQVIYLSSIIKIQKHIRRFISNSIVLHQTTNPLQTIFFLSSHYAQQYHLVIYRFWDQLPVVTPNTLKRIAIITLSMLAKGIGNKQLKFRVLEVMEKMEWKVKDKQLIQNIIKVYLGQNCNSQIIKVMKENEVFWEEVMNQMGKDPLILIRLLGVIKQMPLLEKIVEKYFQHTVKSNGSLLKRSQLQDRLIDIGIDELYSCYSQILSLYIHSIYLNPSITCWLLNILIHSIISKVTFHILAKYNIPKQILLISKEQSMELISEKQQYKETIEHLSLQKINHLQIIKLAKTYDHILQFLVTFINIRFNAISLKAGKGTFSELVDILKVVKYHTIEGDLVMQQRTLAALVCMEKILLNLSDGQFHMWFKDDNDLLELIIKKHLLKIIILGVKVKSISSRISMIITSSKSILQDLYNKLLRTKILNLNVFQNQQFTSKFRNQPISTHNISPQISSFLNQFPFVFPFTIRLQKFREFIRNQNLHHNYQDTVTIRRGHEFEDAFNALHDKNLRNKFSVVFINEFGIKEKGLDAGGLSKQFINRVIKIVLNPKYGMFIENEKKEIMPHPEQADIRMGTVCQHYQFIGKLIGKAMFQCITIAPKFAAPFLNTLVGRKNTFEDLKLVDRNMYNSLKYISNMEQDARELYLTFQYLDQNRNKVINLKYGGWKIPVTNENKHEYVSLLCDYKVNKLLEWQTRYIRKGFSEVIDQNWLLMFNYEELNYVISGSGFINIDDLKNHTRLIGYDHQDITIVYFWQIISEFSEQDKSNLLHFVTACPRPSFLGFRDLTPPFSIAKRQDSELLPTSHTCSNILDLPDYQIKDKIRQKLLCAIRSNSGFQFA